MAMPPHIQNPTPSGWTLVESLVGLTLLAILSQLALGSMLEFKQKYQANAIRTELRATINLARHTAINKNTNVVLCPRRNRQCGPRNSWHNGALVFEDLDHDRRYSPADVISGYMQALDNGRITWRSFRNRSYLLFKPSGLTDWQNGHFQYCPQDNDPARTWQLVLNYAGRIYPSRDENQDGVHEDTRGRTLSCP